MDWIDTLLIIISFGYIFMIGIWTGQAIEEKKHKHKEQ